MFNCVDRVDIKNGGAGGAGAVPRHAINGELYETTDLGKRVFEANPVLTAISNAVELAWTPPSPDQIVLVLPRAARLPLRSPWDLETGHKVARPQKYPTDVSEASVETSWTAQRWAYMLELYEIVSGHKNGRVSSFGCKSTRISVGLIADARKEERVAII